MKRIALVTSLCLKLKTSIIDFKARQTIKSEVNEMSFMRQTVNGYRLDDFAFQKIESHRYMNG